MSKTLVFDNGAGGLKAGTAGQLRPSHIMPNCTGKIKGQTQVCDRQAMNALSPLYAGHAWSMTERQTCCVATGFVLVGCTVALHMVFGESWLW